MINFCGFSDAKHDLLLERDRLPDVPYLHASLRVSLSRAGLYGCIMSKQFRSYDSAVDRVMPIPACLVTTLTEFST